MFDHKATLPDVAHAPEFRQSSHTHTHTPPPLDPPLRAREPAQSNMLAVVMDVLSVSVRGALNCMLGVNCFTGASQEVEKHACKGSVPLVFAATLDNLCGPVKRIRSGQGSDQSRTMPVAPTLVQSRALRTGIISTGANFAWDVWSTRWSKSPGKQEASGSSAGRSSFDRVETPS